jgi:hypothetical protein
LPAWRALSSVHVSVRAPIRLALVRAWEKRIAEPLAWSAAWRRAIEAGTMGREGVKQWDVI